MIKKLTCIVCPLGCEMEVDFSKDKINSIKGNTCKRGAEYCKNEITNPLRTVTTTVRCENGDMLPVKTDRPIPKDKIFEVMKIINNSIAYFPISVGDVIIEDVFGSNVVATADMN